MTIDINGHVATFDIDPVKPTYTTTTWKAGKKTVTGSQVCKECLQRFVCQLTDKGAVYNSGRCKDFN